MDTIDENNPQPTAQIPLLSGNRLALTTALLQGKCYYELGLMFQRLADEARTFPEYLLAQNDEHITRLEQMGDPGSEIWRLFHTIPRKVLESLVLGTFAHDFLRPRQSDRPGHYQEMSGFGVYAVGIAVAGRDGAWLKPKELTSLIENLERYIKASISYLQREGMSPKGSPEQIEWEFVRMIDNMLEPHAKEEGPRFVLSDEDHVMDSWRALVKSLKLRVDSSLAIDSSGNKPLLQGPLYVGCSAKLQNLSKVSDPQPGTKTMLDGSNQACALVMSLMMYMGRQPVRVCRCVTRLWKRTELPIAKILVTALGNSYVSQDGFNHIICGGESETPGANRTSGAKTAKLPTDAQAIDGEEEGEETGSLFDTAAEEYVKGRQCYFYENMSVSVEELRKRQAFVNEFCHLEPLFDAPGDNINDHLGELKHDLEMVQHMAQQAKHWVERAEKAIEVTEAQIKILQDDIKIAELFSELAALLLP